MSLPGSLALVVETTFRNSQAVARAHCLGPRICRLRKSELRYAIDFSTGQDGRFDRNDASPGGGGSSAAMAEQSVKLAFGLATCESGMEYSKKLSN